MKQYNPLEKPGLFEIVTPFPGKEHEAAEDGLFDDCPICQDMRRRMKEGELEVAHRERKKEKSN